MVSGSECNKPRKYCSFGLLEIQNVCSDDAKKAREYHGFWLATAFTVPMTPQPFSKAPGANYAVQVALRYQHFVVLLCAGRRKRKRKRHRKEEEEKIERRRGRREEEKEKEDKYSDYSEWYDRKRETDRDRQTETNKDRDKQRQRHRDRESIIIDF